MIVHVCVNGRRVLSSILPKATRFCQTDTAGLKRSDCSPYWTCTLLYIYCTSIVHLLYTIVHYCTLLYIYCTLLYTIVHLLYIYCTLLYTIVHYCTSIVHYCTLLYIYCTCTLLYIYCTCTSIVHRTKDCANSVQCCTIPGLKGTES